MNETNQQIEGSLNIIGDGSIGHLLTGYLLRSNQAVSLFSRTNKPSKKIRLTGPNTEFIFDFITHPQCFSQFNSNAPTIIAAKAHQLETICQKLSEKDSKPGSIILMMNGLGLIEVCQQWLPEVPVYQAATTQAAKLKLEEAANQTCIQHTGYGETLIGNFDDPDSAGKTTRRFERDIITPIIKSLDLAVGPVNWSEQHYDNLWLKVLINSIINPLTAINNVKNGALIDRPALNSASKQLAKELSPLLKHVQPELSWQTLHTRVLAVATATAKNSSSMRQDRLFQRKTEIDFITGYILKKAQKFGCSLPNHERLYQQVKHLENQTQTSVTK